MTIRREPFFLFIVDSTLFLAALWLTLLLRYLTIPSLGTFYNHFLPFSFLFASWVLVFFIAGLYDKHTTLFRSRLPTTILNAQAINVTIAALFFFLVPNFGVTPKASLAIYSLVSSALILLWRLYFFPRLAGNKKQRALLVGSGEEIMELRAEVDGSPRYPFLFTAVIDPTRSTPSELLRGLQHMLKTEKATLLVLDMRSPTVVAVLPELYNLVFEGVQVLDAGQLYEEVFDREPLSLLEHRWLIENISLTPHLTYDVGKRAIDLLVAFFLGIFSLLFYPFIALAVFLDDGRPIFIFQERIGEGNRPIHIAKFRSMRMNSKEAVTRVGTFLRATRLDELPQLWSVFTGEQSLIGPRPELPEYVKLYSEQIPFYPIRHLIKPGLSGWAQIYGEHAHHKSDVLKTKNKLAYDLYYVKHRSLWLDVKISLKTVKTILSRSGI
ncbi:MAG TPA: sugar transferase [Candidatus Paceibacterota bacterium]